MASLLFYGQLIILLNQDCSQLKSDDRHKAINHRCIEVMSKLHRDYAYRSLLIEPGKAYLNHQALK